MDKLTIYTDGASRGNPGEAAAAWLILRGCDVLESEVRVLGVQTNNTAEYTALLGALAASKKYCDPADTSLTVFSDSELMISQMIGTYAVRSRTLKPLYDEAVQTASIYLEILYVHVPRENAYIGSCDWLCNNALDTLAADKAPTGIINDTGRLNAGQSVLSTHPQRPEKCAKSGKKHGQTEYD